MRGTWVKNSANLIVVNTIFAALAAALLAFGLSMDHTVKVAIILFAASFWLFALTAEGITTAVDECDVRKYVSLMIPYNIGVILLFIGTAIMMSAKCEICIFWPIFITTCLLIFPWGQDLLFLLNPCNKREFQEYLDELEGKVEVKKSPGCFTKIFYCIKRLPYKDNKKLPHIGVYTRLYQSTIHGIGIVAICDIPKDTNIFGDDESEVDWIDANSIKNVSPEIKQLYDDFCILEDGKYGCPRNFNMMTVGWYLNESPNNPNVYCGKSYDFFALRDIKKGEELLVDYSTYSDKS